MRNAFFVASLTIKDSLKNRVLYGIFLLGILMFAFNLIFTGMFSWETGKVAVDMGLSTLSFSGLILIFFFSAQSLSNDIEKKTIYLILSKPISKTDYIYGKFIGLGTVIVLSGIVIGLCSMISVKIAFIGAEAFIPANFCWKIFFYSIIFQTLSLLVVQSLLIFWTVVNTHTVIGTILGLMTYFIGQNIENVKNIILSSMIVPPDSLSIKIINIISWILPNLAVFNIKTNAAYGLPVDLSALIIISVYGISYIFVCLWLSSFFFNRRELA